jgi:hypothetical protein
MVSFEHSVMLRGARCSDNRTNVGTIFLLSDPRAIRKPKINVDLSIGRFTAKPVVRFVAGGGKA